MSKYALLQFGKRKSWKDTLTRRVYFYIFSTNTSIFRRFFNASIRGRIRVDWDSFLSMFKQILITCIETLESRKNKGLEEKWHMIDDASPSHPIGISKVLDFSPFLLNDQDAFQLRRTDEKHHLEHEVPITYEKKKFDELLSPFLFFRPPDHFEDPNFVTLNIVDKSGGRHYCYLSFE